MKMEESNGIPYDDVLDVIEESEVEITKMGTKTCVMTAVLPNGFNITVSSAPVSGADFDMDRGREVCRDQLETKVWDYMGFLAHEVRYPKQHILDTERR